MHSLKPGKKVQPVASDTSPFIRLNWCHNCEWRTTLSCVFLLRTCNGLHAEIQRERPLNEVTYREVSYSVNNSHEPENSKIPEKVVDPDFR